MKTHLHLLFFVHETKTKRNFGTQKKKIKKRKNRTKYLKKKKEIKIGEIFSIARSTGFVPSHTCTTNKQHVRPHPNFFFIL